MTNLTMGIYLFSIASFHYNKSRNLQEHSNLKHYHYILYRKIISQYIKYEKNFSTEESKYFRSVINIYDYNYTDFYLEIHRMRL